MERSRSPEHARRRPRVALSAPPTAAILLLPSRFVAARLPRLLVMGVSLVRAGTGPTTRALEGPLARSSWDAPKAPEARLPERSLMPAESFHTLWLEPASVRPVIAILREL